jgi:hypothetical protein
MYTFEKKKNLMFISLQEYTENYCCDTKWISYDNYVRSVNLFVLFSIAANLVPENELSPEKGTVKPAHLVTLH